MKREGQRARRYSIAAAHGGALLGTVVVGVVVKDIRCRCSVRDEHDMRRQVRVGPGNPIDCVRIGTIKAEGADDSKTLVMGEPRHSLRCCSHAKPLNADYVRVAKHVSDHRERKHIIIDILG